MDHGSTTTVEQLTAWCIISKSPLVFTLPPPRPRLILRDFYELTVFLEKKHKKFCNMFGEGELIPIGVSKNGAPVHNWFALLIPSLTALTERTFVGHVYENKFLSNIFQEKYLSSLFLHHYRFSTRSHCILCEFKKKFIITFIAGKQTSVKHKIGVHTLTNS